MPKYARMVFICITAVLSVIIFNLYIVNAQPNPLPADPVILSWVEEVSADSLLANITTLVDFYTRHTYSDTHSTTTGIGAARNWTLDKFNSHSVSDYFFPWNGYWGGQQYNCYNIHGEITGIGIDSSLVILGGHIDSRGISGNDTSIFAPGADDDASGVSALFEASRVLNSVGPEKSIVLCAFTGEEQGLSGSSAYSQSLYNSGIPVAAMLNMDMIGHIVHPGGAVDSTTLRCFSGPPMNSSSRQVARFVKWVGESYSDGLTVNLQNALDRPGRSGDHVPFYNIGYPSVRIMETAEDVAYQHGPNDVPENLSESYAGKITRLVIGVTAVISINELSTPGPPEVRNFGNGESLIVSWDESLIPPPGGAIRIAYRKLDDLYWDDIISTTNPPPYTLDGLDENETYEISISISNVDDIPSLFSLESTGTPQAALAPEDFETTSYSASVFLEWTPRIEPNVQNYIIERAEAGGNFEQAAILDHPESEWTDTDLEQEQLYLYRIKTRTVENIIGQPSEEQEGQLATHHLGIIIVDATPDGSGAPSAPGDEEVDDFYDNILSPFEISAHWDKNDSVSAGETISDADLAPYNITFFHFDALNASIGDDTTAIRKYLDNGGKVLISGWRMSSAVEGGIGFEHSFSEGDFLYELAGIDSIIIATMPGDGLVGAYGENGYPDLIFNEELYPYWGGYLALGEAAWDYNAPPDVEIIAGFTPEAGTSSEFDHKPIGFRDNSGEIDWILIDMPFFYMTFETADDFLLQAMDDLNAPASGISDNGIKDIPKEFTLFPVFPNPFNHKTILKFSTPAAGKVSLIVYDIQGRAIMNLLDTDYQPGTHRVVIDNANLSSGLYFAKMTFNKESQTRKLLFIK